MSSTACYRCDWYQRNPEDGYECKVRWGTFDVDRAISIARDGRHTRRISNKMLRGFNRLYNLESQVHEPHIAHVDITKPGIAGTIVDAPDVRSFFIEGYHRAVQCMRLGLPFYVLVLSPYETNVVTLRRRNRFKSEKRSL